MKLSNHFSLNEFTASQTATRLGIKNEPSKETLKRLEITASMLEDVREALGNNPLFITSGYRSPTLNRAIGGSTQSAHCLGYAIDFTCPAFGSPLEICKAIMNSGIKFDQLIYEGTWVHISVDPRQRMDCLTATFVNGKAKYSKGLPNA